MGLQMKLALTFLLLYVIVGVLLEISTNWGGEAPGTSDIILSIITWPIPVFFYFRSLF